MPIPVAQIDSSPLNPRKHFAQEDLDALAASLQADGLLQPIVVKKTVHTGGGILGGDRYEIVAGERRWRAAKQLGWAEIPAILRADVDDATHLRLALLENLARTDLDPLEEAEGYRQLNEMGMTQAEIATAVHRSQPAVANAIRLLKAPESVRTRLAAREITPSHVLALLRFEPFPQVLEKVAEIAIERRTPTKELEKPLGWEFTQALREAKLVVDVGPAVFDWRKVCQNKCPFGAFLPTSYGGHCMKPEHFRALQKDARAKEKAKVEKAIEKLTPGDKAVLKLNQLKPNQFERIYGTTPAGCSEECACRRSANDWGSHVVQICIEPARYRGLADQERVRAQEKREAAARDLAKRCGDRLDAVDAVGSHELAVITAHAIERADENQLDQVLAKHAPGFKLDKKAGFDDLASLPPLQLVKITLEVILGEDIAELQRWQNANVEYAPWYAGATERKPKRARTAGTAAIEPKPEDAARFDPDARLAAEIAAVPERLDQAYTLADLVGAARSEP